jgi:hypothetical protein
MRPVAVRRRKVGGGARQKASGSLGPAGPTVRIILYGRSVYKSTRPFVQLRTTVATISYRIISEAGLKSSCKRGMGLQCSQLCDPQVSRNHRTACSLNLSKGLYRSSTCPAHTSRCGCRILRLSFRTKIGHFEWIAQGGSHRSLCYTIWVGTRQTVGSLSRATQPSFFG